MSEWKIGGILVDCLSVNLGLAQTDSAEVEFRGDAPDITDGDWVALTCDAVTVIYGRATVQPMVSGRRDAVRVTIKGPWELLESTTYQQQTKVSVSHAVDSTHPYGYALANVLTPEVLLGMDDDGAARTTIQEALAIIAYAAAAGVPLTLSAGFTGIAMQPVNVEGSSCAACLLTVLRFHPDVLLYFDYSSGTGAVLMATPVDSAAALELSGGPSGSARVLSAQFSPVLNYAPAGIRILYQRISTDGRIEVHTDSAGTIGSAGAAPNVINWLVKLEGADPPPLQTQRIRTRPIPHSDDPAHPEDDETEGKTNWWQAHLPWLNLSGVGEIVTISEHTVTVDEPHITPSEDDTDGIEDTWSLDPDDYPRELIDGTIPPWLSKVAAPLTITATLTLGDLSGVSDADKLKLAKIFKNGPTVTRTAQVTGTDANTREYAAPSSIEGPPDWPASGIAAAYMAAFSAQAWQGSISLTGAAQPRAVMGKKLNVSGYDGAWASMNAVIRSISYSPSAHELTISCGPPDNFGFGDFYELQRTMKKAAGTDARAAAERRTLAIPNSGGKIKGAGFTANRAVSTDDGGSGGDRVPWQCEKAATWSLRVWPAQVWDSGGTHIWPTVAGVTATPESHFDADIVPSSGAGFMYLECTVDDTEEYTGTLSAAALKLDYDDHDFITLDGDKVLIPICEVLADTDGFTIAPLRTYPFCLRRYGPPGSMRWDVTPL